MKIKMGILAYVLEQLLVVSVKRVHHNMAELICDASVSVVIRAGSLEYHLLSEWSTFATSALLGFN